MSVPRKRPREPIAVVGMACRSAGADSAAQFWELVRTARSVIAQVPTERVPGYTELTGDDEGLLRAGLMGSIDRFDADFFGIKPAVVAAIDPQHRLLVETCWQALESAAIPASAVAGEDVGVFAGVNSYDYRERAVRYGAVCGFTLAGTLHAFSANQLSYQYDLHGPSITVDTACSSGLQALTLAVSSLRSGQLDTAVVGAANVICDGYYYASLHEAGVLSQSGYSVPFDVNADGYLRGEGVVCLVLKRLSDAVADRDPVHMVIAGVAANHDGRTATPTAPSAVSQTELIARALADAGVDGADVGYVEAHGTGTRAGDPAEVAGITAGLGLTGRTAGGPDGKVWVGSVKANIGHTEAASGLFGLIKAGFVLRSGVIPATPGFTRPHPDLPLDGVPVRIADTAVAWPHTRGPRLAGVNGFGFGGANVHLVLTEAPMAEAEETSVKLVVPLSAPTESALRRVAAGLAGHIQREAPPLSALAWSMQTGRVPMAERVVVLPGGREELCRALRTTAAGEPHPLVASTTQTGALADHPKNDMVRRWLAGEAIDWAGLWSGGDMPRRVPLPPYPFAGGSHWLAGMPPAIP